MKSINLIALIAFAIAINGCSENLNNEATKAVQDRLSDPESAQFRKVTSYRGNVVCGEVNAKNKLGGYIGFRFFVYDKTNGPAQVTFDPRPDMAKLLCNSASESQQAANEVEQAAKAAEQVRASEKLELSAAQTKCDEARFTQSNYNKLLENPATDIPENRKIRNDAVEVADYQCERAKALTKSIKTGG